MSDINTGGEHWGNDWIERVETAAEKYGVECHGVPLNVGWFLDLLDAAVEKERTEAIEKFAKWEDANNINYHEYSSPEDTVRIYLEELKEQSNE